MPLMELLETHEMLNAQLLQVDTEGYDGEILKMIDFSRFRPALIKYEHKNIEAAERRTLESALREHDYKTVVEGTDTIAWTH
jgi:hypothetical protein